MPETDAPTPATTRRGGRLSVRALLVVALLALLVYGLDQLTKLLVVANLQPGETAPLLGELLQLHYVTNSGAAFSLASGFTWILSIVALGVVVVIIWFARRIRSIGWAAMFGLVLGGALGNLTDRIFREPSFGEGHVVDFLQLWAFPAIFNIADVAITSGMAVFIILTIRGIHLDGSRGQPETAAEPAPTTAADTE